MTETGDAKLHRNLSEVAPPLAQAIKAGSKLRGNLSAMLPVDRAGLLIAVEAARIALGGEVTVAALCLEAGISAPHYAALIRNGATKVSPRFLAQAVRGIKTFYADRSRPPKTTLAMMRAAYQGCLAAACMVNPAPHDLTAEEVLRQLARRGEFPSDTLWRSASLIRAVAIYLASTEVGLRTGQIAAIVKLSPAAVSMTLGKIEQRRDDAVFDALIEKAAEQVRGER